MIIATSCYRDDEWRLLKLLKWIAFLQGDETVAYPHILCILYERRCQHIEELKRLATKCFTKVFMAPYEDGNLSVSPLIENKVMRMLSLWMDEKFGCPWFFLDNDSVPLKVDWAEQIEREYYSHNEPFMGHIVEGMGHMTGACAMYPPRIARLSLSAMTSDADAQDRLLFNDKVSVHRANHLIHQVWNVDANGNPTLLQGEPPTFKSTDDVIRLIPATAVIFHRCKDASLIEVFWREVCV